MEGTASGGASSSGISDAATWTSTGEAGSTTADGECPNFVHQGDLTITPEATKLDDAYGIAEVTGDLRISDLEDADDLAALHCLRRVSGMISIRNNEGLLSLQGLSHLEEAESEIFIRGNGLESLEGLESLRIAEHIEVMEPLTSFDLPSLEEVGELRIGICSGGGEVFGDATWQGLPTLERLGDLRSLRSVGLLWIEGNDSLVSLDGLRAVADNGGQVDSASIRYNINLPTEHANEIADLIGGNATVCGNLGDENVEECVCGNEA